MLEQNHDFEELKQWCEISDMRIANIYLHGKKINFDGNMHKTRKRYTEKTMLEIREHYMLTQNYAATAKEFGVNESTIRIIVKTPTRNGKLNDKGNHSRAGRPLTYPLDVEKDILSWLLELRDFHVPVSILTLQERAKRVVRPHNPTFNGSRGWVERFFGRHRLSLLSLTSVSQKLPKELEGSITKSYEDARRYMRIGKYPRSLVANMDETPAFFGMIPTKSICKTGSRECIVRTSIVRTTAATDGTMLPPMLIFKGKTDKTIKKLRIPEGFIVKTQEKSWMDEGLMEIWVEDIWLKYVREVPKQLGFDNSLLTFDAFSAHKTDDVQSNLVENKSDILVIPPGCTSKCQPMDVCINKSFNAILRKCWVIYFSKIIKQMPATTPDYFKLPPPSLQDMVDWVEEVYRLISSGKDMVKRSFDVCGITTSDPAKVRSGSFYDKCMRNAKYVIEANELEDEDPFELQIKYYQLIRKSIET